MPIARGRFNIDRVGNHWSGVGLGAMLPRHREYLNILTAVIGLKLNLCSDVSNDMRTSSWRNSLSIPMQVVIYIA